ncbi:MAG TPA: hypothetical protein DC054_06495 [Blastocatellia bacterium]|nr:hypothetical protein [Blastocatellia bacterium]
MAMLGIAPQLSAQSRSALVKEQAASVLARARDVMGSTRIGESVIHYRAGAAAEQNYQSDRTYPPFFSAMQIKEAWFDPRGGVERIITQATFPGGGPSPAQVSFTDAKRAFIQGKEKLNVLPRTYMQPRYLNPWTVIADWTSAGDASFVGEELYRDYPRIVLARKTSDGEIRLFIDAKTGYPVKLDFQEKHYLWGQRHIEYLYSTWIRIGNVMIAGSSFRLADGKTEIAQTVGDVEILAREAAPSFSLPGVPEQSLDALPPFLQPLDPKVEQVGPKTYLLANPGYAEMVTEVGNEIFVFDTTQGEERARKDSEAIARLFPGRHNVTVVITDLAWPHVAGVRYWVASGATIIAHKAAREFLQSVVDRRWTLVPDLLERRRKTARLKFVGIDTTFRLASGAISLHPIDGIGSEVALMGYVAADHFLWASDYIQTVAEPTAYASEIWRATQRDGLHPEHTAAEHLPLTPWSKIVELQK